MEVSLKVHLKKSTNELTDQLIPSCYIKPILWLQLKMSRPIQSPSQKKSFVKRHSRYRNNCSRKKIKIKNRYNMTIRQKAKLNLYTSINVQDYLLTVCITWTKYLSGIDEWTDDYKVKGQRWSNTHSLLLYHTSGIL